MSAGEGVGRYERCRAFVEAQAEGEWGDDLIAKDARKLLAFINAEVATANQGAGEWRVPEGWRLVPEVPTQEMIAAWAEASPAGDGWSLYLSDDEANARAAEADWSAMLAASPTPPVRGGDSR